VEQIVLQAMAQSRLKQMPPSWQSALTATIKRNEWDVTPQVVSVVRSIPVKENIDDLKAGLLRAANSTSCPTVCRLEALAAVPGGVSELSQELLYLIAGNLTEDSSVPARAAAVDALANCRLSPSELRFVADVIPQVGPLEINRLLALFENC